MIRLACLLEFQSVEALCLVRNQLVGLLLGLYRVSQALEIPCVIQLVRMLCVPSLLGGLLFKPDFPVFQSGF